MNTSERGRFGIITNLSNGGLCIALVGSPNPLTAERIDLKVNRQTFMCNVVSRGKEGLHCRFDDSLAEPLPQLTPPPPLAQGGQLTGPDGSLPPHATYDHTGQWRYSTMTSGSRVDGAVLTRIYSEGCFVGREQIDAAVDTMHAAAAVLNPYHVAAERHYWSLGFTDAVRHMAKSGRR